jgi:capsular exopolysaccharide synthesis family protein
MTDAEHPSQGRPLTLTDLLATCWRRRWLCLTMLVVVTATVVLATFRITPLYEATATLSVDRGRKPVDFQYDPSSGAVEFGFLNTHRDMLMANPVMEQALATSDLLQTPAYADAVDPVKQLRDRVRVTTKRDSWIITVALRDEVPARAKQALEALLAAYAANQSSHKSERASGALSFLSTSVDTERKRLDEARKREQDFRIAKAIVSNNAEASPIAQRLDLLNRERASLDQQLAGTQALLQQFAEAERAQDPAARLQALLRIEPVGRHPVVVEQQQQLYLAQDEAQALRQKYGDKHPRMLEANGLIVAKQQRLEEAVALGLAGVQAQHQKLQFQYVELLTRTATAERELNGYRTSLASLQALEAETKSREEMFNRLLTRMGEEEVASRLDAKQVVVFDPPKADSRPVNIRKSLFAAGALAAGLVAAVLAALGAEALDRRVRGAGATQELTGLPLLGQLPFVSGLVPLGKGGDPDQPPVLAEAYRALRAALRLTRRGQSGSQVLVVTSSGPGEGKSTVSTRLGIALAAAGARVLLVDADLRKPTLHKQLGDDRERGLSFLLAGEEGIEPAATDHQRLDFLPVGVRPPNPSELLHSPAFATAVGRWRLRYDFVLIDSPPLGLVSDALSIAEMADGLLLVARDRITAKGTLRLVLDRLQPLRSKVLGLVFNAEQLDSAGYGGYRYAYGYRYGYGQPPEAKQA